MKKTDAWLPFGAGVLVWFLFWLYVVNLHIPNRPLPCPSPIMDEKAKLVDWVYANSSKISRTTAEVIVDEVIKYNHPIFLLALMAVESEFVPSEVSTAKARGLGQIRYEVHQEALKKIGLKEPRDLFNVGQNVLATDMIFRDMLKRKGGDPEKALHAYLGGKDAKYTNKIFVNLAALYLGMEWRKADATPITSGEGDAGAIK